MKPIENISKRIKIGDLIRQGDWGCGLFYKVEKIINDKIYFEGYPNIKYDYNDPNWIIKDETNGRDNNV